MEMKTISSMGGEIMDPVTAAAGAISPGTALVGFMVGLLVGLTGVGGAALLTPVMLWMGVSPTMAVGTDLFYNSVTKLFGTLQHWRQKTVNWKLTLYLAAGSVPGAVAAVMLLNVFAAFFHNHESVLRTILGVMLVVAAAAILFRLFGAKKQTQDNRWQQKPLEEKKGLTVSIGFVLGFLVGLTSIGSGSLFALALLYLYRLKSSDVVGTDIAHAFFLVTAAGLLHAGLGNVNFGLAFNLLIGSVPGVLIGSRLSSAVPTKPLRAAVAALILLSGISLM